MNMIMRQIHVKSTPAPWESKPTLQPVELDFSWDSSSEASVENKKLAVKFLRQLRPESIWENFGIAAINTDIFNGVQVGPTFRFSGRSDLHITRKEYFESGCDT